LVFEWLNGGGIGYRRIASDDLSLSTNQISKSNLNGKVTATKYKAVSSIGLHILSTGYLLLINQQSNQ
jgi:hypothetical protein